MSTAHNRMEKAVARGRIRWRWAVIDGAYRLVYTWWRSGDRVTPEEHEVLDAAAAAGAINLYVKGNRFGGAVLLPDGDAEPELPTAPGPPPDMERLDRAGELLQAATEGRLRIPSGRVRLDKDRAPDDVAREVRALIDSGLLRMTKGKIVPTVGAIGHIKHLIDDQKPAT
jgi:hypothetical protein